MEITRINPFLDYFEHVCERTRAPLHRSTYSSSISVVLSG